jgi:hypothetical protein
MSSSFLDGDGKLNFGKHRGKTIDELPHQFISTVIRIPYLSAGKMADLQQYLKDNPEGDSSRSGRRREIRAIVAAARSLVRPWLMPLHWLTYRRSHR